MLELFLIFRLSKKNGERAVQRGRKPGAFKAFTWLLWLGFEFLFLFGAIFMGLDIPFAYVTALIGAALGALVSYLIAKNCKPGDYTAPYTQRYVPPLASAGQAQSIQMLQAPCIITIHEQSADASGQILNMLLNGKVVGSLYTGQTITAQTMYWQNALTVIPLGGQEQVFYFGLVAGQTPVLSISGGQLIQERCLGIRALTQQEMAQVQSVLREHQAAVQ